MPERITAVIFDMDGVLIDSSSAHLESWRRLAADLGSGITEKKFRETFGRQNRDIIPLLFGASLAPTRIEELSETKERYYRELVADHVPVIPGAASLVNACHAAGMKCAIGSSGHPENIAMALRHMQIEHV
ncbi:MAG: HAD family phosphatase, partial [Planctomycetes bacterium]|nr:HAD family phosphatase [Planctomycetota bacterium]